MGPEFLKIPYVLSSLPDNIMQVTSPVSVFLSVYTGLDDVPSENCPWGCGEHYCTPQLQREPFSSPKHFMSLTSLGQNGICYAGKDKTADRKPIV